MGKKIPLWQVLIVIVFAILCFIYGSGAMGRIFGPAFDSGYGELHIPLVIAAIFAAIIAALNGWKWSFIENGIVACINRAMAALLILMTVGILMGS